MSSNNELVNSIQEEINRYFTSSVKLKVNSIIKKSIQASLASKTDTHENVEKAIQSTIDTKHQCTCTSTSGIEAQIYSSDDDS